MKEFIVVMVFSTVQATVGFTLKEFIVVMVCSTVQATIGFKLKDGMFHGTSNSRLHIEGIHCSYGMFYSTSNSRLHKIILYFRHWLTNSYAVFGLPYFLYDIGAMYDVHYHKFTEIQDKPLSFGLHHFLVRNKAMMVHHIALPLIFYPAIIVRITIKVSDH